MNLYVRYFEKECLATSVEESIAFLRSLGEVKVDNNTANRITTFLNSSNIYPFRLKVNYNNYVLFLKTEANNMEEFKEEEKRRKEQKAQEGSHQQTLAERKKSILDALNEEKVGWYESTLVFKRVILMPETQKFQYIDTPFSVRCKAKSAMHCYNQMIEYLKSRKDIDSRSQFPSAKSANFNYKFLGSTTTKKTVPAEETAE